MYSLRPVTALFARIEGLRRLPPRTSSLPILDPKGGSMKCRSYGGDLLRKSVACISAMIVASAILQSGTASAHEGEERGNGELLRSGNGPGPAANGPGPGCNIIPPLASIGTKIDISQFPPPDSLTDPELAGPVQLLKSGKFEIPIEQLTGVNVPAGTPRGTITPVSCSIGMSNLPD